MIDGESPGRADLSQILNTKYQILENTMASKIMNYLYIKYTLNALLIHYDINYNGVFDALRAGQEQRSFEPLLIIKVDQNSI